VVRRANNALHSSPSSSPDLFLYPGNILWLLLFGWWLSVVIFVVSLVMMLIPPKGRLYGLVLRELAFYLLWPFGRYVERHIEITPSSHLETGHSGTSDHFLHDDEEQGETTGLLPSSSSTSTGRKDSRWYTPLVNGFKLGPAGWFYYLLFFTIIGKSM
jgi:Ca2+:H+ antiporter